MASIGDYLEGDVAAEVRVRLEAHLSHCSTCQVVYDSARKTITVLTESGSFDLAETASRPITEKIMSRIRGQVRPL
jgi:predicted anti-sigma-YlaC factor YlaD